MMRLIVNTTQVTQVQGFAASGNRAIALVTATTVSRAQPLSTAELAHACGADVAWVSELVALGLVGADDATPASEWHFHSADLQCALELRRLQRDFDVGLEAAALMLDLQHEVRRLKATLHAHGNGPD